MKRFCAGVIGVVLGVIPFGAGLVAFMDPLRRKAGNADFVRVTSLDALPADGVPRKFPIVATRGCVNKL
jgi:menaquinol-cytochrome c reductase iron-sulfur subunit